MARLCYHAVLEGDEKGGHEGGSRATVQSAERQVRDGDREYAE